MGEVDEDEMESVDCYWAKNVIDCSADQRNSRCRGVGWCINLNVVDNIPSFQKLEYASVTTEA